MPKEFKVLCFLVVLSLTFLFPVAAQFVPVAVQDEGVVLNFAERLLQHQVPYLDFFAYLPPGSGGILALWFSIFGVSYSSARFFMLLVAVLLICAIYLLSTLLLPRNLAPLPPLLFACAGVRFWPMVSHHWIALLCFAGGSYLLLSQVRAERKDGAPSGQAHPSCEQVHRRFLRWPGSPLRVALLGVMTGAALLTLPGEGIVLLLVGSFYLFSRKVADGRRQSWLLFLCGILLPVLPVLLYLIANRAFLSFISQCYTWVITNLIPFNLQPYDLLTYLRDWKELFGQMTLRDLLKVSDLSWLLHAVCFMGMETVYYALFYPVLLLSSYLIWKRRGERKELAFFALLFLLWTLVLGYRQNRLYLHFLSPFTYIAFFLLLELLPRAQTPEETGTSPQGKGLPVLFMVVTFLTVVTFLGDAILSTLGAGSYRYPISCPRGVLYASSRETADSWNRVIAHARSHVGEGESIFAFPYNPALYFASARKNATRHDLLVPVFFSRRQATLTKEEMEKSPPRFIYLFPFLRGAFEEGYPAVSWEAYEREEREFRRILLDGYVREAIPDQVSGARNLGEGKTGLFEVWRRR